MVGILIEKRFRMPPQLEIDGFGRAAFVFVANGRPYTYMGPVPVNVAGRADFAGGLDFVAPREVAPAIVPRLAFRGFRGRLDGDPRVLTGHDLDAFHVRCDVALPLQADGEDLGDVTEAIFEAERDALDRPALSRAQATQIQSTQRARLIPSSSVKVVTSAVFRRGRRPEHAEGDEHREDAEREARHREQRACSAPGRRTAAPGSRARRSRTRRRARATRRRRAPTSSTA